MEKMVGYLVLICSILHCEGKNFRGQYEEPQRRFLDLQTDAILGAPSMVAHLPEAEPMLPGHTLIRPAMGMLKSSIKFPHRELENGAGVYGHVNNLGIRWDGRNERVLYSGFRRMPEKYIEVAPIKIKSRKPKFVLSPVVLDLDKHNKYNSVLRKIPGNDNSIKRYLTINRKRKVGPKFFYQFPRQYELKYGVDKKFQNSYSRPIVVRNNFARQPLDSTLKNNRRPRQKKVRSHLSLLDKKNSKDYKPLQRYILRSKTQESDNYDEYNDEERSDEPVRGQPVEDVSISFEDEAQSTTSKKTWFWDSKNLFNHLKVPQDAPEYNELMPSNMSNKLRSWWFYHQDDYEPFKEKYFI